MRLHIDLAVVRLSAHRPWLETVLANVSDSLARIRLHDLEWERFDDLLAPAEPNQAVRLRVDVFVQCSVALRRYDLCLLPVSLDTLAWTRQALASIPRGPFVPLVGLTADLRSGALLDLLELGLHDFIGQTAQPDEFRARVLNASARAPRAAALRETVVAEQSLHGRPRPVPMATAVPQSECRGCFASITRLGWPDIGFAGTKQRLVDLFERQYLQRAMAKSRGNIAVAARNSQKDRRAFWELLRKHDLIPSKHRPQ